MPKPFQPQEALFAKRLVDHLAKKHPGFKRLFAEPDAAQPTAAEVLHYADENKIDISTDAGLARAVAAMSSRTPSAASQDRSPGSQAARAPGVDLPLPPGYPAHPDAQGYASRRYMGKICYFGKHGTAASIAAYNRWLGADERTRNERAATESRGDEIPKSLLRYAEEHEAMAQTFREVERKRLVSPAARGQVADGPTAAEIVQYAEEWAIDVSTDQGLQRVIKELTAKSARGRRP